MDPNGIANWSVTHVDWSEGKWHPKAYRAQDVSYELLKNITVCLCLVFYIYLYLALCLFIRGSFFKFIYVYRGSNSNLLMLPAVNRHEPPCHK
jgi:hypothetical protein